MAHLAGKLEFRSGAREDMLYIPTVMTCLPTIEVLSYSTLQLQYHINCIVAPSFDESAAPFKTPQCHFYVYFCKCLPDTFCVA